MKVTEQIMYIYWKKIQSIYTQYTPLITRESENTQIQNNLGKKDREM